MIPTLDSKQIVMVPFSQFSFVGGCKMRASILRLSRMVAFWKREK
jgi:hypothetical protein